MVSAVDIPAVAGVEGGEFCEAGVEVGWLADVSCIEVDWEDVLVLVELVSSVVGLSICVVAVVVTSTVVVADTVGLDVGTPGVANPTHCPMSPFTTSCTRVLPPPWVAPTATHL